MLDIYMIEYTITITRHIHRRHNMATASLFTNGKSQAVRIPKELEFEGINEVEITRNGDSIVLTPRRKSWSTFSLVDKADDDFMDERTDVVTDGRVSF
jgi:antitoxin VapB